MKQYIEESASRKECFIATLELEKLKWERLQYRFIENSLQKQYKMNKNIPY